MIHIFRLLLTIIISVLFFICCAANRIIHDDSAGMNGSFEIVQDGIPVNWIVYAPETIQEGDYDLIIDTLDFKDGHKSLKFDVRACSGGKGWVSPGISNQYYAIPGDTYKISFWIKNEGSLFSIIIGGVAPKEGAYETIIESNQKIDKWRRIEYIYTMPPKERWDNIRFEMNILEPGIFRIDDIRIEDINGVSVLPVSG